MTIEVKISLNSDSSSSFTHTTQLQAPDWVKDYSKVIQSTWLRYGDFPNLSPMLIFLQNPVSKTKDN